MIVHGNSHPSEHKERTEIIQKKKLLSNDDDNLRRLNDANI